VRNVLVVGASLAGLRTAEALRAEGYEGRLTVLGAEAEQPYDRPPLSKEFLAGSASPESVRLDPRPDLDATWLLGDPALELDLAGRVVSTAAGLALPFDGLVIATGSQPRRLGVLAAGPEHPLELRTLADAMRLRAELGGGRHLTIVGAGFIGVEVASTARRLGVDVAMVSLLPPLSAAGPLVSSLAAALLRERGVRVHAPRTIVAVRGSRTIEALELDDGTSLPADVVVSAVGVGPATEWLRGSGLDVTDGVLCDSGCAVPGAPGVVAVGDVARRDCPTFGPVRIEHWSTAIEQARVAARTLLGKPAPPGARPIVPSFWSDHFDLRLQSLGLPGIADEFEVVDGAVADRRFAAAGYANGKLVGAVAYGMPRALAPFRSLLSAEAGS
jgi:NADPH-dependent 2,4-dienoyl-CoA reductase/sulfur reductase-like enzyme